MLLYRLLGKILFNVLCILLSIILIVFSCTNIAFYFSNSNYKPTTVDMYVSVASLSIPIMFGMIILILKTYYKHVNVTVSGDTLGDVLAGPTLTVRNNSDRVGHTTILGDYD